MRQHNVFQNAKIVDGTPYHVDFPDDWINTEYNEQLICDNVIVPTQTGPRFCGNCAEFGVDENGIFVEYCFNCDDYIYNGTRRISASSTSVYQRGLTEIHVIHETRSTASSSSASSSPASRPASSTASNTTSSTASNTTSCTASRTTVSSASNIPLFTNYTDINNFSSTSDY